MDEPKVESLQLRRVFEWVNRLFSSVNAHVPPFEMDDAVISTLDQLLVIVSHLFIYIYF